LIAGGEPLIVQECADAVRAKARVEGYGEREVFDADSGFDWSALTLAMASLSLFCARRLFDLRLPTGKPGREGSEVIQTYCADPPPDTVLLVTAQEWSKAHAGKWSDAIGKQGHVVPVWPLKTHEQGEWLQKRLRSRGLSASPQAVRLLAERVEGNLLAAAQEIDKLALIAPGATLEVEEMERLVADSSRFDVFKLAEAALAGDAQRACRMLHSLRAEGDQVPGLLPMVAVELLKAGALARVQAEGGNMMNAMREARVWESKQALYRRAVDRHPVSRWEAFAAEVGRIDLIAKGRRAGDAWLALERLLVAVAEAKAWRLLAAG
jgi:DNA polymerase-3 subunit delta